ncbi:MAG TPA: GNAT family N-acetyltransferase [Tepidisphaeraceae bacterium]|jgi:ribosomal protein S18 acetylase RimI-like enzyme
MSLPILEVRHEPSETDLVRLFHRTEAMWVGHLADGESLDVGTAYANGSLSRVWDANNVRDASLAGEATPQQAVAAAQAHYASRGTRCAYWVMNPSAGPEQTQPLIDHLVAGGHRAQSDDILYLRRTPAQAIPEVADLKIIPARASYRHVRRLVEEKTAERWPADADQLVDAHLRHLDDPHVDALLALRGERPVAFLGVLAVGELGRIESVYVSAEFRGRGIGRVMMARGLEICARSLFKHVYILAEPANGAAQSLYQGFGFEKIGEVMSYRAAVD